MPYNLANVKFWKKNYVLTLVLSEKKNSERNKKPYHPEQEVKPVNVIPPFRLDNRFPMSIYYMIQKKTSQIRFHSKIYLSSCHRYIHANPRETKSGRKDAKWCILLHFGYKICLVKTLNRRFATSW